MAWLDHILHLDRVGPDVQAHFLSTHITGAQMPADWVMGMTPLVSNKNKYGSYVWQRDDDGKGHNQATCRRSLNWSPSVMHQPFRGGCFMTDAKIYASG